MKNYTFTVEEIAFTYDTLSIYSHMQRTVCTGRPEPVSFAVRRVEEKKIKIKNKIHKSAAKSPTSVSRIPARTAKKKYKSKHGTIHQQPQSVSLEKTSQENGKHSTECTKATHDSLTPWHSSHEKKKTKRWKKTLDQTAFEVAGSTPQRAN